MLSPFPSPWNPNWISILLFWARLVSLREAQPSTPRCFKANSSPHHLGINLPRCHASTHINWLELFIFISTDARSSDKTYLCDCFFATGHDGVLIHRGFGMSVACCHMISRVWTWGHFMSDTSELWAAGEKIEMEIMGSFRRFFKMCIICVCVWFFFIIIIFFF